MSWLALAAIAILLYYLFFFEFYCIEWSRAALGAQQLGRYFLRMFVWHDFMNWPFGYYFSQIGITLAIVFAGTLTASIIALPLSFFAARNVMHARATRPIAWAVRPWAKASGTTSTNSGWPSSKGPHPCGGCRCRSTPRCWTYPAAAYWIGAVPSTGSRAMPRPPCCARSPRAPAAALRPRR